MGRGLLARRLHGEGPGSAWLEEGCTGRVLRGGSWGDSDVELHAAARTGEFQDLSSYQDGLRVARGL